MKNIRLILTIIAIAFTSLITKAEVHVADIFSNNMVLQRDIDLKIWGKADSREKVWVYFNGQKRSTRTDKNGIWEITLKPMKESQEPLEMTIRGKNEIVFNNILIGDVWVCSGQSNMQMKVSESGNAETEIKNANHPTIRLFTVPNTMSNVPVDHIPNASWEICASESSKDFSAVGYFFGRDIQKEIQVPIGLIHTAWGATCVETWTSKTAITKLPKYENFAPRIDNYDPATAEKKYEKELREALGGFPEKELGMEEKWMLPNTDHSDWLSIEIPNLWENAGYNRLNGRVWFSVDFQISAATKDSLAYLHLGKIHDSDITWVNGHKVGGINWANNIEREYAVPTQFLHEGKNNITVRVEDKYYKGGFASKSEKLYLQLGTKKIALSGTWKFKVDTVIPDFKPFPNDVPSLLYNAMIHPLIPFGIKGVIWYQGESNTPRSKEYEMTFPNMINNWREDWQQGDFPFLFVQLANFQAPQDTPKDDAWAELREAQTKTLKLKNTGMAVAIDIGAANNIHPLNKQEVGRRLMLSSLKVAYHKDLVYSGPLFKSMEIDGDKAIISFDHIGAGLHTKDKHGYLTEFEIAGSDKKFYWAKARLVGEKVVLTSAKVKNPVAVRFGWSSNPAQLNLYNKEGLPASPFRTDNWEGITDGKSFDD